MTISPSPPPTPTLPQFFRMWLSFGLQSFGGGAATLALIRHAAVDQHRWLSDSEFTKEWGLCQIAPGINLLALTILIGRRVKGGLGVPVALAGLLLPSVALTVLLTALYSRIKDLALVRAALRGIVPATVGLGAATALQMALPPLQAARREGMGSLLIALTLLIASGLAVTLRNAPVVLVLLIAASVGALAQWLRSRGAKEETQA